MTYTGGTTGMPKGVVGMVGPGVRALLTVVPPMIGQPPVGDPAQAAELATRLRDLGTRLVTLPACPLMHGTGMVIGLQTPLVVGGSIVLLEGHRFDPEELWALAQRHRVVLIAIVGDAFARPMLRALDVAADHGRRWDLGALRLISSSGAMFSQEVKEGLLEHLAGVTLLDYISSTEGLMGVSVSTASAIAPTGRFRPVPGVRVFADDGGEITAGSGEPGLVGLSIGVPLGYHKDTVKSARTFREVDGVRYSFPGDWATVEPDGSLALLGRGSQSINTGGEKVFPEEVEEVIKRHPRIEDCLVFGVSDERFGQRVVAVASPAPGQPSTPKDALATDAPASDAPAADALSTDAPAPNALATEALATARQQLAGYKLPRQIVVVDTVPRAANGKADYAAARAMFEAATRS